MTSQKLREHLLGVAGATSPIVVSPSLPIFSIFCVQSGRKDRERERDKRKETFCACLHESFSSLSLSSPNLNERFEEGEEEEETNK